MSIVELTRFLHSKYLISYKLIALEPLIFVHDVEVGQV